MPKQVSPVDAIRVEINNVFGSGRPIDECLEELMRLSVRLVLQQILEDEVTGWLGRDWNSRSGKPARDGQRNGHSDLTIKTTAGPVKLARPKLRGTTEKFASTLLGKGVVRSAPLEALVISVRLWMGRRLILILLVWISSVLRRLVLTGLRVCASSWMVRLRMSGSRMCLGMRCLRTVVTTCLGVKPCLVSTR